MNDWTKLDRAALALWPVLVAVIVAGCVFIIACRGWLVVDVGLAVPVLGLALVLTYGLIGMMTPARRHGSLVLPSRHE